MNPAQRSAALRGLAELIRCGLGPREALSRWPGSAAPDVDEELKPVARRAALGLPLREVLAALDEPFQEDARPIAESFRLSLRGANGAAIADRLAVAIDRREAASASGRAAASGARVSARLVAGLPLGFVPIVAAGGAPLLDRQGIVVLALGLGFLAIGLAWLRRLVPVAPQHESSSTRLARVAAELLRVGVSPRSGVEIGATVVGGDELTRALRLTRLGLTWPQALAETGDSELARLALILRNSQRAGTPLADTLEEFARREVEHQSRAFETARRKAPILMVLPLALCVLPAFVLLAVVPFLRSLAISA